MTIRQFIEQNHIASKITRIPFRTDIDNSYWDTEAKHYAFRVYITHGDKYISPEKTPMIGYYSQGSGIKTQPTTVDILNALIMDSMGIDSASFDTWCGDYGYDTDSRKAYKTYQTCLRISLRLKELLGLDLFNKLMDCKTL